MFKQRLIVGACFAALATIIGAFGAHYLKQIFTPEQLTSFEVGVRYQFYHAGAILITALLGKHIQHRLLHTAYYLFTVGIVLFSGSIYLLNFLKAKGDIGLKGIGILTPIGGTLFIVAWICIIIATIQGKEIE